MNKKEKHPIYINDWAMSCALGDNKKMIKKSLSNAGSSNMCLEKGWLNDGKQTVVGKIKTALTGVDGPFNTRNNQIAYGVLQQIQTSVEKAINAYGSDRIAVIVGTSTSGMSDGEHAIAYKNQHGEFPASYHYQQQELGNLGQFVAKQLKTNGPTYTISTACSSSARAFISAKRLLKAGIVDAVIVGGCDSLCRLTLNGFHALDALSSSLCNPFSVNRRGINIGEAGAFMLLSKENTGKDVCLLGVGDSSDAYHISAPDPQGKGAIKSMQNALMDAQLSVDDIGYINAHGTATKLNDEVEARAIYSVFKDAVPVSSIKPLTGHTLGASGIVEACICCFIISDNINLPMQINDGIWDKTLASIRFVSSVEKSEIKAIISNSFAFGGNNVSLIFGVHNG